MRIIAQKKHLEAEVNSRTIDLEEAKDELIEQKENLLLQKEKLEELNAQLEIKGEEILKQNIELAKHRENLELLIKERTKELEKAKLKAEESDRLKTAFLANMSHEIRTPMNAILGFSSLLKKEDISKEDKEMFINIIDSNCDSLIAIIDDIIDLSRIESEQLRIFKETFEINKFLGEIFEFYNRHKKESIKLYMELEKADEKIFIKTDKTRLQQILTNLISNAIKFTQKGTVTFGYKIKNNKIQFFVEDTGIGIKKEDQKKIFNRFVKIEEVTKNLFRGAGLGLTISNKLANKLNGNITVESKPGEGSKFILTIPLVLDKPKSKDIDKKQQTERIYNWQEKTIAIVEDEKSNYLFLKKIFEPTKAEILWFVNGKEFIDVFESDENNIDIVLMDLKMPIMNGYQALSILQKKNIKLPVIAQTAYAHEYEKESIKGAGFTDYIIKPIKQELLLEIISYYI